MIRLLFYSLFQLNAEGEISRSGIEQQAVVEVLGIKDLPELFCRHQVIVLQFVVKRQMTVFADLICDMQGKLSDSIFNHPVHLFQRHIQHGTYDPQYQTFLENEKDLDVIPFLGPVSQPVDDAAAEIFSAVMFADDFRL